MSEADLQRLVIDAAHMGGWLVAHFRTARTSDGRHLTAVEADGAGYPDLTLVHRARGLLAFLECKAQRGRTSPAQDAWLGALREAAIHGSGNVLVSIVHPGNVDDTVRLLISGW